jgi:DNA sulfur modification protein DndD
MRDGQSFREPSPQNRIHSIVPPDIAKFLFFNGENIDHLAMEENAGKVAEAIQQMLGLKLLRTTIDDLKHQNVRGKFMAELRDKTSEEKQGLIDELQTIEGEIAKLTERRNQELKNSAALENEIQLVEAKLEANREAAELQLKRASLQKEQTELQQKHDDVTRRLSRLIADDGYTLFAKGLVERGREIVGRLRSEGKIPARVLNTFLQELLESKLCICTRCLESGTPERGAVENLLTIAGDQDFNNAVGALENAIGLVDGLADRTREQLRQLNIERVELAREIRVRLEGQEEIHQKLGSKKDNQVQELEDQWRKNKLARDALNVELGRIAAQNEAKGTRKQELDQLISQLQENEEAAALAQRRKDAVDECISVLDSILAAEIDDLRPHLKEEINLHFQEIIDRSYWAELTPAFTVCVKKKVAGPSGDQILEVAKNQAMRQALSLSFIASLVALAGKRSEIPTIVKGLSGALYPLVMDSPFGTLDRAHRNGVAKEIPALANQVVALISSSQFEGAVAETFKSSNRVGKCYYLVYHGPELPKNASRELVVDGIRHPLYFKSDIEFTEIKEL